MSGIGSLKEEIKCFHFNIIAETTFVNVDAIEVEMDKIYLTSEDGEEEEISLHDATYEIHKSSGQIVIDIYIPDKESEIMSYLDEDYSLTYNISVYKDKNLETSLGTVFEEVVRYIDVQCNDEVKDAFSFLKAYQINESDEYLSNIFDILNKNDDVVDIINIIAEI